MSHIWWIINFFTTAFEFYLFDDFMSKILTIKGNRPKLKWLLYPLSGVLLMLVNTLQKTYLDVIFVALIYFLLLNLLYQNGAFEKTFYIIIFLFSVAGIEYFVRLTCFYFLENITSMGLVFINILSLLAALLIEKLYLIFTNRIYDKIYQKWFLFFLIEPLIYIIILIGMTSNVFLAPNISIIITGYIILSFNAISFYLFEQLIQSTAEKRRQSLYIQRLSMNESYYRMMEKKNEKQSLLIHDFKHHIHAVTVMAHNGDILNIQTYLTELENSYRLAKTICFTNNNIANLIISEKQAIANEKNISFNIEIKPCDLMFLDFVSTCSLFSNLLDNAIQAAEKCQSDKWIILKIIQFSEHYIMLQIDNSYQNISIKGNHLFTTKSDTSIHGYGLKQIKSLVENQGGVFTYEYENNTFSVVVMLKCD